MEKSTRVQLIHPHTLSSCVPRPQVTEAGLSAHLGVCLQAIWRANPSSLFTRELWGLHGAPASTGQASSQVWKVECWPCKDAHIPISRTHDTCCDLAKGEILAVNGIKVVIQTPSGIYGVSRYNQGITGALQGGRSGWNALRRAWLLAMNAEGENHERRDPERTRGWQGNRTTIPITY